MAGRMPSTTSVNPNCASSAATTTSQTAARPDPPPSAAPWTQPMSGTGMRSSARNIDAACRASAMFSSREKPIMRDIHCTSAPAEKTVPAPRRTTARTEPSAGTDVANAVRSAIMSSLNALRTSGRLSVTVVMGPDSMSSAGILHPEDAELRIRNRRVVRGGEAERERIARASRVENAVVPQSCGRVVGRALAIVLLEDRRANGVLLVGRKRPAFAGDLILLDGGQHRRRLLAAHHRDARVRPHPQQPRLVGAAAHAVVAGAERSPD